MEYLSYKLFGEPGSAYKVTPCCKVCISSLQDTCNYLPEVAKIPTNTQHTQCTMKEILSYRVYEVVQSHNLHIPCIVFLGGQYIEYTYICC